MLPEEQAENSRYFYELASARFLTASVELMEVMARACGHTHLNQFSQRDITTWKKPMAELARIAFTGEANQ